MEIIRDADKRYRIARCKCGNKYRKYEGAGLGSCDVCLDRLAAEFWQLYDARRARERAGGTPR